MRGEIAGGIFEWADRWIRGPMSEKEHPPSPWQVRGHGLGNVLVGLIGPGLFVGTFVLMTALRRSNPDLSSLVTKLSVIPILIGIIFSAAALPLGTMQLVIGRSLRKVRARWQFLWCVGFFTVVGFGIYVLVNLLPTADALGARLRDPDASFLTKRDAIRDLQKHHPDEAGPHIVEGLYDKDKEIRKMAVKALCELGPRAKAALPQFKKVIRATTNPYRTRRRVDAAFAYWKISGDPTYSIEVLVNELKGMHTYQKLPSGNKTLLLWLPADITHLLNTLSKMGPQAKGAVPKLVDLLTRTSIRFETKPQIAETLGAIGPDAKAAVPALTKIVVDCAGDAIRAAPFRTALQRIDPNAALPPR